MDTLERDPEKRRVWMEETFPAIKKRADQEGEKIYFADEAACRTDHHGGRSWAPVGETPVVEHIGARETIGMVSAISMRGDIHWMIHTESMNSSLFTAYLNYLIQDIDGKIFLIVDRARYHTSEETSGWLARHKDRIELFFLPSYSPDLNPDEWVWKTLSMTMSTASCRKSPDNCSQSLARLSARSGRRQKRSEAFSLTPILPTSGEPAHSPGFLQKPSFLLVAGRVVWACRPASLRICHRWLPEWLPEPYVGAGLGGCRTRLMRIGRRSWKGQPDIRAAG